MLGYLVLPPNNRLVNILENGEHDENMDKKELIHAVEKDSIEKELMIEKDSNYESLSGWKNSN